MSVYKRIKSLFLRLFGMRRAIVQDERDTICEIISLTLLICFFFVFLLGWLYSYICCVVEHTGSWGNVFQFFMIASFVMLLMSIVVSIVGVVREKTELQIKLLKAEMIILIWVCVTLLIGKWATDTINMFTGYGMGG